MYRERPSPVHGTRTSSTCRIPKFGLKTENVTTDRSTAQDQNELILQIQKLKAELTATRREREQYVAWFRAVRS